MGIASKLKSTLSILMCRIDVLECGIVSAYRVTALLSEGSQHVRIVVAKRRARFAHEGRHEQSTSISSTLPFFSTLNFFSLGSRCRAHRL
jgi:hypothetical protein